MSRIGKMPIEMPGGVSASLEGRTLTVKGPKGEQSMEVPPLSSVKVDGQMIQVERANDEKMQKAQHGLTRSLINNLVIGVTEGFSKELEVNGVGFKIRLEGKDLVMSLGFSHEIRYTIPEDVDVKIEKMDITVSGINKQRVGRIAAEIREFKKPEPYKGKGIKYKTERVVRKAGKSGK
ncbi:MAG: 50S ribosomal protein L6 [Candidatus Nomurabacteria bacterium]|nr:MAG: 50S ribosomal protein L6 [Candidatus Nomurabacteria bacterium]HRV76172.1 50S ribosomal protein L6 [Candidatus Saccharimonadales bacterium]